MKKKKKSRGHKRFLYTNGDVDNDCSACMSNQSFEIMLLL